MPSACVFRAWLRENRNGLETHVSGGGIEDRDGELLGKIEIILKCVLGVVARLKLRRKSRLSLHSLVFTRGG